MFENIEDWIISSQAASKEVEGSTHNANSPVVGDEATRAQCSKLCNKCLKIKSYSEFHIKKTGSIDGYRHACKACAKAIRDAQYLVKKDHVKEVSKAWYEANKEHRLAVAKAYKESNPDLCRERIKTCVANKKEQYSEKRRQATIARRERDLVLFNHKEAAKTARRRACKQNAHVSWADDFAIAEIYMAAAELQAETGIEFQVDHIIPLKNEKVCGLHVEYNLQILTRFENGSKGNRFTDDIC